MRRTGVKDEPAGRVSEPAPDREPTGQYVIEVADLTKFYPDRKDEEGNPVASVRGVDLRVPAAQVYGLLGRNGAGKSTTIRMIATLLEPTSGTIRVCGLDTSRHRRQVRSMLGVALGGERSVYWKLTARQNLEYFAALHGTSRKKSRARIHEVLEEMDLADRADDYVERYSTGMRQRLVIARALLNRPGVLLLDEPASGLDPHAADNLHNHIRRLRDAGHTILVTTHDMAEADLLSDRVGIIDKGRLVAEGTPAELKRSVGAARVLHLQFRDPGPEGLRLLAAEVAEKATVREDAPPDERPADIASWTLSSSHQEDLAPWLFSVAARHGTTILRMENELVTLRHAFLSLTGEGQNDASTTE
ncbi:ABC transporter ATP-binding protein [Streptomyces sp. NPDC048436]|uniref:ABC transporter ATP-binding protein n=1 Tax=Streptomyces sp. NPDC048436 TaxID=3365550 RepID=UPI003710B0CD